MVLELLPIIQGERTSCNRDKYLVNYGLSLGRTNFFVLLKQKAKYREGDVMQELVLNKDERAILGLLKSSDVGLDDQQLEERAKMMGVENCPHLIFGKLVEMGLAHFQEKRGLHKADPKAWEV